MHHPESPSAGGQGSWQKERIPEAAPQAAESQSYNTLQPPQRLTRGTAATRGTAHRWRAIPSLEISGRHWMVLE